MSRTGIPGVYGKECVDELAKRGASHLINKWSGEQHDDAVTLDRQKAADGLERSPNQLAGKAELRSEVRSSKQLL